MNPRLLYSLRSSHPSNIGRRTCRLTKSTYKLRQRLAISCQPPEGDGRSSPCIYEPFFHFPRGFESMGQSELAAAYKNPRLGEAYAQCKLRRRDEDWPTLELHLKRTPETKDIRDVLSVLGRRRVTMVGASITRATVAAIQCAMTSYGLRAGRETQFLTWGWAQGRTWCTPTPCTLH